MTRRKSDSPQKAAMREMMQGYLKENDISIKSGNDVNSIMRDMMSVLLEGALDEELNEELGYSKYDYRNKETDNSRNGHSRKTMRTSYGDMDIAIPRDRKGEYEPQLIPKYQNTVTQDMEEKIISMYAKGMTTGDIEAHLKELYDLDISDSTISRITDKIMPLVKEWQERPLQEIYAVVYMDAIHYHVRSEGFNRQLRKVTKSRTVFPSDDSLLKMLYLATMDITKKWTGRRRDWSQIRAQLEIYFEERLEKAEF